MTDRLHFYPPTRRADYRSLPVYEDVAVQFAKRFIQNRDTKAIQFDNGDYVPDFKMRDQRRHGLGFTMDHLSAHLEGRETYGHYLLDNQSQARMFAFDIDLEKEGTYCVYPNFTGAAMAEVTNQQFDENVKVYGPVNPRELWLQREQVQAREWYKRQMMRLVHKFTRATLELGVPAAAAYSGGKGVHVYGFTGPMPADEVRAAADLVMAQLDEFELWKGKHFFRHKNLDPITGFGNFSVEVFPKQVDLEGKNLGNLMRLPLGRNRKSQDPTFFLDLKAPAEVMRPHPNPVQLLESGNPYA